MTEHLKEVIGRLEGELAETLCSSPIEDWPAHINSALEEAIRAALAEPTESMLFKGMHECEAWKVEMVAAWNAMAAERLKELE